ncbi:MAG TPA: ATP-binding cassette domain-containing protein [Anaerolineales bacterium]|nr:ATP-binding cassette domain-containing protein [Anaerolineales bacterium]
MEAGETLLEMRGMSKRFGSVDAVIGVDLFLKRGEILGLVGDNAAGKSTLMKLLTAVHKPDAGEIYIEGKPVIIDSPQTARRLGIEMIYQDYSLAPNLSIVDNIFLGRELKTSFAGIPVLNRKKMNEIAQEVLGETHIEMASVQTVVTDLSGGQQQAVAIARALAFDAKIIIMDEPTASLSVKTIPPLLDLMKRFRDSGISMVFITHRIQDIFSTCDRAMVLRRGVCVGSSPIEGTNIEEVTAMITGSREAFGGPPKPLAD